MAETSIEWTDKSYNPIVGCTRKSEGCRNCWSERFLARFGKIKGHKMEGISRFTEDGPRWSGEVRFVEEALNEPLKWRKPSKIFVCSTSDLFHENVKDEWIDNIFTVMAVARQHTFQVLTKRPERMLEYLSVKRLETIYGLWHAYSGAPAEADAWPLPNVWLGVSVEDQKTADERIPLLLKTPAAVRWISAEPLLGPITPRGLVKGWCPTHDFESGFCHGPCPDDRRLDWVVVGGESGPGSRAMDVRWARDIVRQCKAEGTAVFVKQLGAKPFQSPDHGGRTGYFLSLKDRKGGDMAEWPEDLCVREYPR